MAGKAGVDPPGEAQHVRQRLVPALAALVWSALGGAAEQPAVAFERHQVCLASTTNTVVMTAEIATTPAQRAHGLMEREHLPSDAGMLFIYERPQPADHGFWMFRTQIPLDVAFIGPEGEIRSIQAMEPCQSPTPRGCKGYPAGVEFSAALEVNQGFFREHGIGVGDRVLRSGSGGCGGE